MKNLALALVLALVAFSLVAGDTTKIRVEVKNLANKPVERASVIVEFGGRSVKKLGKKMITRWELRTNQEGVAKVPELPQGKISVKVIAKGYQTFGKDFEINEDEKTIEVKLNPPQPQYTSH